MSNRRIAMMAALSIFMFTSAYVMVGHADMLMNPLTGAGMSTPTPSSAYDNPTGGAAPTPKPSDGECADPINGQCDEGPCDDHGGLCVYKPGIAGLPAKCECETPNPKPWSTPM